MNLNLKCMAIIWPKLMPNFPEKIKERRVPTIVECYHLVCDHGIIKAFWNVLPLFYLSVVAKIVKSELLLPFTLKKTVHLLKFKESTGNNGELFLFSPTVRTIYI